MKRFITLLLLFQHLIFTQHSFCVLIDKLYNQDNILELISKIIPANATVVEAGSCQGKITKQLNKMWPKAHIYAFEPYLPSFSYLVKEVRNIPNITYYSCALGSVNGMAELYVCNNHPPACSLLPATSLLGHFLFDRNKLKVPIFTIDTWRAHNAINPIDLLYLDTEGSELSILQGALGSLSSIKAIYSSVNFKEFRPGNTLYSDLKAFLVSKGFKELWKATNSSYQGNVLFINSKELK